MQELIALIRRTKMPVICICNDRGCQKVRALANHCLDLAFVRPAPREVVLTLHRVAKTEGYSVDDATLEKLAESCNSDIRQVLNMLQIWRPRNANLSAADVSKNMANAFKDISVGAFDVAGKFFREANSTPLDTRLRHYFVDSSMCPLLVQESYLGINPFMPDGMAPAQREMRRMARVADAAQSIVEGDVVGCRIMSDQQWSLAPLHGVLACARPGHILAGPLGRPGFPSWLGKNSTMTKRARLLREFGGHMQAQASGDKAEIRQAYVPALRAKLLAPLLARGSDGIPEVIALLDEYHLSKDDFDAIMELELLTNGAKASVAALPSAVKSTLTRKYNQAHTAFKKGLSSGGMQLAERYTEDAEEEGGEEEEDAEVKIIKKVTPKAAGKAKAGGKAKAKK